jgi:hypothetical protein
VLLCECIELFLDEIFGNAARAGQVVLVQTQIPIMPELMRERCSISIYTLGTGNTSISREQSSMQAQPYRMKVSKKA